MSDASKRLPLVQRIDAWLMEWLDGRWYGTVPGTPAADFWARLCLWQNDRYWRRYGEGPLVSNGDPNV